MDRAFLVLEDGTVFSGKSFGAKGEAFGEVVFNTSITGYQEIITDPSYFGQMVTMTYPLIGNYGVNLDDFESERPYLSAFIVKEYSRVHSNYRASESLGDFLNRHNTIGIHDIDTRRLVRHIREKGSMNAVISTETDDLDLLKKKAKDVKSIVGQDLVKEVTTKTAYEWTTGSWNIDGSYNQPKEFKHHIVAVDFGIKRNILRYLVDQGCKVTVVPATTTIEEIDKLAPDGIFLSNGPGDPAPVTYGVELAAKAMKKYPLFGICLGNQILCLAVGAKTYKLKFGHHGGNQPVKNLATGKVEITSQNHCFAVDEDSIRGSMEVTHVNLNDNTVEGIKHTEYPSFAVQYHPENGPGPHDSLYLFQEFVNIIENK